MQTGRVTNGCCMGIASRRSLQESGHARGKPQNGRTRCKDEVIRRFRS
jgi:hypothetical protein